MNLIYLAGLSNLKNTFIDQWLGPLYLLAVAAVSIMFLKERQIRQLIMFALIAAIVGIFVFSPDSLVGKNGTLTKGVESITKTIDGSGGSTEKKSVN